MHSERLYRLKRWVCGWLVVSLLVSLYPANVSASSAAVQEAGLAVALAEALGENEPVPTAAAATGTALPVDIKGTWAQKQIESWIDKGFVSGFPDGTFKPGSKVSRAELAAIINRAFGFTEQASASFKDVPAAKWYAADVARAQAAGYMKGGGDGTFRPDASVTRQEAAVVLAKLLKLDTSSSAEAGKFADSGSIAAWSLGSISASVSAGLVKGYTDNTFKPAQALTRAETVVLLDRAHKQANGGTDTANLPASLDKAGTYGPEHGTATHAGDLTIDAADVTLRNVVITGNLVLGEAIGEGDATLDRVTVLGTTTVKGGGENSVHLLDSKLTRVVITKVDGQVRVIVEGSTAVDQVTVSSGATLQVAGGSGASFGTVEVSTTGEVTLNGNFPNVVLVAPADLKVTGGSLDNLTLTDLAAGAKVEVAGDSKVSNLNAGSAATISGTGQIVNATVTAAGVSIAQTPDKVAILQGVTAEVGGKSVQGGTATPAPGTSNPGPTVTSVSVSVSSPSTAGLTISLVPALPGLTEDNIVLTSSGGTPVFNANLQTSDNGSTYQYSGIFRGGDTYTLSVAKSGYGFGASKSVAIPDLTAFIGAILTPDGKKLTLLFTKELASLPIAPAGFSVTSGGAPVRIVSAEKVSATRATLTLEKEVTVDSLQLSYTPGTVTSVDSKPLIAFKTNDVLDGTSQVGGVNYSKMEEKTVSEAAAALIDRFPELGDSQEGAKQIGASLLDGGYSGVEVAGLLHAEFQMYEDGIAFFLIEQGFGVTNVLITLQEAGIMELKSIGKAMRSIGISAKDLFTAMKFSGYDLEAAYSASDYYFDTTERYGALRAVFGLSEEELATFLKEKEVSSRAAAAALMSSKASTTNSIIGALYRAKYTEDQIAEILKAADLFNVNAFRATTLLFNAGFDMDAAANIMKSYYHASAGEIASALKQQQLSIADIIGALGKGTLGFTQAERWNGLRSAFTIKEIVQQYRTWQWKASDLVGQLAAAGFPVEEVEDAIALSYGETISMFLDKSIPDLLWDNFSLAEVAAGMRRSGDSSRKVGALLESKGYKKVFETPAGEDTVVDMLVKAGFEPVGITQYLRPLSSRDLITISEMNSVILQLKDAGYTPEQLGDVSWKMVELSTVRGQGNRGIVNFMFEMQDLTTNDGRTLTKLSPADIVRVIAANGVTVKEMHTHLKQRFTNAQIAGMLKEAFSLTPAELMYVIANSDGGYCTGTCPINETTSIIKSLYSDLTFDQAAKVLYASGIAAYQNLNTLVSGIEVRYGASSNLVPTFRELGMKLSQIVSLNSYRNRSVSFWKSNGYTAAEVYLILDGQDSRARLSNLKSAGYSLHEIMLAAQQHFNTQALVMQALQENNLFPALDVASVAEEVYGQSPKQAMASLMKNSQNSSASATTGVLRDVYQVNDPIEAAGLLKDVGYSRDETLTGIFNVYSSGNAFVAGTYTTLKAVIAQHYPDVSDAMGVSLRVTGGDNALKGANILKTLDYTLNQIVAALKEQYTLDGGAALNLLIGQGFGKPIDILNTVSAVYNVEALSFVAAQEKAKGKDAYMTRSLFKSQYGYTDEIVIAQALSQGGYSKEQVLAAMFNQTGDRHQLVPEVMKQVYGETDFAAITTALRNLGETTYSIYEGLRSVFPNASRGDIITGLHQGGLDGYHIYRTVIRHASKDAKDASTIGILRSILGIDAKDTMDILQFWGYSLKDRFLEARNLGYSFDELGEALAKSGETPLQIARMLGQLQQYGMVEVGRIIYQMSPSYEMLALYLYAAGWFDPAQLANALLAVGCDPEDIVTVIKLMVTEHLIDMVMLEVVIVPIPQWTSTYMGSRLSVTDMSLDDMARSFIKSYEKGIYNRTDLYWGMRAVRHIALDFMKDDLPSDAWNFLFGRSDGIPFMVLKEAGLGSHAAAHIMRDLGIQWQPAIMFLVQAGYSSGDIASALYDRYFYDILETAVDIISTIAQVNGSFSAIKTFIKYASIIAYNIAMKNYHSDLGGNPDDVRNSRAAPAAA